MNRVIIPHSLPNIEFVRFSYLLEFLVHAYAYAAYVPSHFFRLRLKHGNNPLRIGEDVFSCLKSQLFRMEYCKIKNKVVSS